MRFIALLRKELREAMPWILLACLVVLAVGILAIRSQAIAGFHTWRFNQMQPGETVSSYVLTTHSVLHAPAVWLMGTALTLGLILAVRQFAVPFFTHTWPFLLHRSVNRSTVLAAKLAVAALALLGCLGAVWVILYEYACQSGLFPAPPPKRIFIDGWLFLLLAIIAYLGAALSALSTSRWYTTRIFGLAAAALVLLLAMGPIHRPQVLLITVLGGVLLLSQTIYVFLTREF